MSSEVLLDIPRAAAYLHKSEAATRVYIRRHGIPNRSKDRRVLVWQSDLVRVGPTPAPAVSPAERGRRAARGEKSRAA